MREKIWKILRWILFHLDAEFAHRLTVQTIKTVRITGGAPLRWIAAPQPSQTHTLWGLTFRSRVGLAAGFDKNAEIVSALPDLGFGFAEIGTVTPEPQDGNAPPRLFRDLRRHSLFNRMGFNNDGAIQVARNLTRHKRRLPSDFPVGVNIGKNRGTTEENAAKDYSLAAKPFRDLADYLVINISSPNTPGLRALQNTDALRSILDATLNEVVRWNRHVPVCVKLAPELDGEELAALIQFGDQAQVSGWILTNTWAGQWEAGVPLPLQGGWSGKIMTEIARSRLETVRKISSTPIVSVGGIMNEADGIRRIQSGADLIQLYTGWVYGGPELPGKITKALEKLRIKP